MHFPYSVRRIVFFWQCFAVFFLLYFLFRVQFVIWNSAQFSTHGFKETLAVLIHGVPFDLVAVSHTLFLLFPLLLIPHWKWTRIVWWTAFAAFLILSIFFCVLNVVDIDYINFVGRRFIYTDFSILGDTQGKLTTYLLTYWKLSLINIVFLLSAMYFLCRQLILALNATSAKNKNAKLKYAGILFVTVVCFVVAVRGGVQTRPLGLADASRFEHRFTNHAVNNTTFAILRTMNNQLARFETYFADPEQVRARLNSKREDERNKLLITPQPQQNVVIFAMESFAEEYKEFMPFLNELEKKSFSAARGIANAKRSLDAIPSIAIGFAPMADASFIFSTYMNTNIQSLPVALKKHGYQTAFFHGGNNGSMHFDAFSQRVGFDNYFGANEYPNKADHDGTWGIFDEPFFLFMGEKLTSMKQPFFAMAFSLSSHHPYKLPPQWEDKLPSGPIPILKTIAYSDQALKSFFEYAKKQPWYNNTLFIITADHTANHYKPEFQNVAAEFWVPILFFHPRMQWPQQMQTQEPIQHIDFMPSIYDFLGFKCELVNPMSKSIFRSGPRTAIHYSSGHYSFFSGNHFATWNRGEGEPTVFKWQPPTGLDKETQTDVVKSVSEQLKANIQFFNESGSNRDLIYRNLCE